MVAEARRPHVRLAEISPCVPAVPPPVPEAPDRAPTRPTHGRALPQHARLPAVRLPRAGGVRAGHPVRPDVYTHARRAGGTVGPAPGLAAGLSGVSPARG